MESAATPSMVQGRGGGEIVTTNPLPLSTQVLACFVLLAVLGQLVFFLGV